MRFTAPALNEIGTAVGYGQQGTGRRQRSDVKVLALGPANATYETASGRSLAMNVPANELTTTESTCYGDSGGPLFDTLGQVVAVASRGLDAVCNDCPTYWTTIAAHEKLIRDAATAAGHPLPAASATPNDGRNAATGSSGARNDDALEEAPDGTADGRRARGSAHAPDVVSAGCTASRAAGTTPTTLALALMLTLALAANRRRQPRARTP